MESYIKSSESLPASLFDLEGGRVVGCHISDVSKIGVVVEGEDDDGDIILIRNKGWTVSAKANHLMFSSVIKLE